MSDEANTPIGSPTRIAAVVVTHNSADILGDCLRSLCDQGDTLVEVVVADNVSSDATRDITKSFDGVPVRFVEVGRNGGYSAGINAGIKALDLDRLDAVLVLNPDCRLRSGSLSLLASALEEPGRGIAVPRLVNIDGTLQPSLRNKPSVRRAMIESLMPGGVTGRLGTLGERITDPRVYEREGAIAWATGAAMLITVPVLREIGLWDESFLLYSEETEYSLRAADRGWSTWYNPIAVFEHAGGESSTNPILAALLTINRVTLFRRRNSPLHSAAYFVAVTAGECIRAASGRQTSRASVRALLQRARREEVRAAFIRGSGGKVRELAT